MKYYPHIEDRQQRMERLFHLLLKRFRLWTKDGMDNRNGQDSTICHVESSCDNYDYLSIRLFPNGKADTRQYIVTVEDQDGRMASTGPFNDEELLAAESRIQRMAGELTGWWDKVLKDSWDGYHDRNRTTGQNVKKPYADTMLRRWRDSLNEKADELGLAADAVLTFAKENVDRWQFLQREGVQIASTMTVRLSTGQVVGARVANAAPGGLYPVIRCEDGTYMNLTCFRREDFMQDPEIREELVNQLLYLMIVQRGLEESEHTFCFFSESEMKRLGKRTHALVENGQVRTTRNPNI